MNQVLIAHPDKNPDHVLDRIAFVIIHGKIQHLVGVDQIDDVPVPRDHSGHDRAASSGDRDLAIIGNFVFELASNRALAYLVIFDFINGLAAGKKRNVIDAAKAAGPVALELERGLNRGICGSNFGPGFWNKALGGLIPSQS
jgi:hypothetical protein